MTTFQLILALCAAAVVAWLVVRRGEPREKAPSLTEPPDRAALEATLRSLIGENRKISAIKELRDATRLDLRDAKRVVEAMTEGQEMPEFTPDAVRAVRLEAASSGTEGKAQMSDAELDDHLRALTLRGKKIKAIKELRDARGLSLVEAKDYVERL